MHLKTLAPIVFFFHFLTAHAQQTTSTESTEVVEPAKSSDEKKAEVVIAGMKNPELKPYRILSAGMDAYDEYRHLAPQAPLLFQLRPRDRSKIADHPWQNVKMRLAGEESSMPIPILDGGRFTLPRSEKAYDEDAELILNQKKSSYSMGAHIRTSGLAKNVLRMGDMRVSCEVMVGMAKKEIGFILKSLISTLLFKIDWCEAKNINFSFPISSDVSVASSSWAISMKKILGNQESSLDFSGTHFNPQFWDKSISPDTLYEFELWSDLSAKRKQEVIDQQAFAIATIEKKNPQKYVFQRGETNQYRTEISLKEGVFSFSMGTEKDGVLAFEPVTFNAKLELEKDIALKFGMGRSSIKIEQAGMYQFNLDLSEQDQPKLSIKRKEEVANFSSR
jgi:hypothetical protein